ncbi:hypothetical protein EMIT043CA1_10566 [Pseudomonas brassicacearum]
MTLVERLGLKCKFRTSHPTNGNNHPKNFMQKKPTSQDVGFFEAARYQVI